MRHFHQEVVTNDTSQIESNDAEIATTQCSRDTKQRDRDQLREQWRHQGMLIFFLIEPTHSTARNQVRY